MLLKTTAITQLANITFAMHDYAADLPKPFFVNAAKILLRRRRSRLDTQLAFPTCLALPSPARLA